MLHILHTETKRKGWRMYYVTTFRKKQGLSWFSAYPHVNKSQLDPCPCRSLPVFCEEVAAAVTSKRRNIWKLHPAFFTDLLPYLRNKWFNYYNFPVCMNPKVDEVNTKMHRKTPCLNFAFIKMHLLLIQPDFSTKVEIRSTFCTQKHWVQLRLIEKYCAFWANIFVPFPDSTLCPPPPKKHPFFSLVHIKVSLGMVVVQKISKLPTQKIKD